MIDVQLTNEQAILFDLLLKAGVFNIRNGSAALNFDSEGTLTEIETKVKTYKRGKVMHTVVAVAL